MLRIKFNCCYFEKGQNKVLIVKKNMGKSNATEEHNIVKEANHQLIKSISFSLKYSFVLLKCLQPKKPL